MKSQRRFFHLNEVREKTTKWVFKTFVEISHVIGENVAKYFPDLPHPKDGISDQGFSAFFGSWFVQLQIGSSRLGHGKDKPCSMLHCATQAEYSNRHFFRIQAAVVESGYGTSDHDQQGFPAVRELTPKFWACLKPLLEKHFKDVPKDIKDHETIVRWIAQLIHKGRDYLASQARVKALAEKPADPAVAAAAMRKMREMLSGRGGGDPAPAV